MTNKGKFRFIFYSIIGVLLFFIPFNGKIVIEHITGLLIPLLNHRINIILLLFMGILSVIQKQDNKVIFGLNIMGLLSVIAMNFTPFAELIPNSVPLAKATITVSVVTIFLPFILDYGLIETVGNLASAFMKKVFKIPGSTAVICASATMGSNLVGIIGAERLYNTNRITKKESAIITTGFATLSIGFMVTTYTLFKLPCSFFFFFLSSLFVAWLITFITARIPPLSLIKEDREIIIEPEPKFNPKFAIESGIAVAEKANPLYKAIFESFKRLFRVIPSMISSALFLCVCLYYVNTYTPILEWIGMIFYPIMRLLNFSNIDVISRSIGMSLIEIMNILAYASPLELTNGTKYILAALPITVIIYFGAYLICMFKTDVRVKFHILLSLWVVRMLLSLIFLGIISLIFF